MIAPTPRRDRERWRLGSACSGGLCRTGYEATDCHENAPYQYETPANEQKDIGDGSVLIDDWRIVPKLKPPADAFAKMRDSETGHAETADNQRESVRKRRRVEGQDGEGSKKRCQHREDTHQAQFDQPDETP